MRIPLLCSIILALALTVFAQDPPAPPAQTPAMTTSEAAPPTPAQGANKPEPQPAPATAAEAAAPTPPTTPPVPTPAPPAEVRPQPAPPAPTTAASEAAPPTPAPGTDKPEPQPAPATAPPTGDTVPTAPAIEAVAPPTTPTDAAPQAEAPAAQSTPTAPATKAPAAALAKPPADSTTVATKKGRNNKISHRARLAAAKKAFGLKNNVPPLLAPTVSEPTPSQPPAPWAELLGPPPLRHILTIPPLLAGIRSPLATDPKEEQELQIKIQSILTQKLTQPETEADRAVAALEMLAALVDLQKTIKQQIAVTGKKLKNSSSEAEKQALQEEMTKLDQQLSETGADFERIATGVEADIFADKKQETFSWKDEIATLLEPSIKQLKQLTARARLKTQLKETIVDYNQQVSTAHQAVDNLNKLIGESKDPKIKAYIGELLPAWQHVEKRLGSKLELAQLELNKLENRDQSLIKNSGSSIREFFRTRGLYLLIALLAFVAILLAFKLISRLILYVIPGSRKEQRPFHVRILDIFFQVFSVASAIGGLIFVLYSAEDWFLLSMTIIIFLGLVWTVRQALPKMWQQVRLVLNMGSIREGERVVYNGVPWKVESLNVFCKLYNPALALHVRIPIENMIGLISRPFHADEPWFPCMKDDWVAIDGKPFAKVVSLSHEQVEVVELGGRRTVYQTSDFLAKSPTNLSRNFNIRVVFGLSYDLQAEITTTIPATLKAFLHQQLVEAGWGDDCLNLNVDFLQAGASSLDLVILADFKGEQAVAYRRIERALGKWCVDCCNQNHWEIPFPQMTVHLPAGGRP